MAGDRAFFNGKTGRGEVPVHLRFEMWTAYDCCATKHPHEVMRDLGITYQHATPLCSR